MVSSEHIHLCLNVSLRRRSYEIKLGDRLQGVFCCSIFLENLNRDVDQHILSGIFLHSCILKWQDYFQEYSVINLQCYLDALFSFFYKTDFCVFSNNTSFSVFVRKVLRPRVHLICD